MDGQPSRIIYTNHVNLHLKRMKYRPISPIQKFLLSIKLSVVSRSVPKISLDSHYAEKAWPDMTNGPFSHFLWDTVVIKHMVQ